jgi:hypothetical protein
MVRGCYIKPTDEAEGGEGKRLKAEGIRREAGKVWGVRRKAEGLRQKV